VFLWAVRRWFDPAKIPKPVMSSHAKPMALVLSDENTKAEVISP
jgi:hypothetical protein